MTCVCSKVDEAWKYIHRKARSEERTHFGGRNGRELGSDTGRTL